jgi:sialate O-acetylesterase
MVLLAIAEKSSKVIKIQATYLLLAIGLISFNVSAQLKTATIFSDHMLLQRDEPIIVWGKALPEEEITVLFSGLTRRTITNKDSTWKVVFPK